MYTALLRYVSFLFLTILTLLAPTQSADAHVRARARSSSGVCVYAYVWECATSVFLFSMHVCIHACAKYRHLRSAILPSVLRN